MRPDGTPHLYETPMVPNLLPFPAAVTTGGGPTQTPGGMLLADSGFAAMVTPGTAPTTVQPPIKGVAVLPLVAPRLVGLNDSVGITPGDAAPPERIELADPSAVPVAPVVPLMPILEAAPIAETAPVAQAASVVAVVPVTPQPAPVAATEREPSALPNTPIAKPAQPTAAPAPSAVSVTVSDAPDTAAVSVVPPAFDPESGTDAPHAPAKIATPAPLAADAGGTVPTAEQPDRAALPQPPTPSDAPVAPAAKSPAPVPLAGPEGGSVTTGTPVRKTAIPAPSDPKPSPTQADGSVAVIDNSRAPLIIPMPDAPVESTPVESAQVESAPVAIAPAMVTPPPVDDAVPQSEPSAERAPAQLQIPVVAALATAPVAPVVATPAAAPVPAQVEPAAAAAAAPVALRVVEPAPAEVASDAPADEGAFDTLVTAKSDADTDTLRTATDTGGDAMNRDGNRQSAPQPAAPAPAAAPSAAAPLPAFDPLAAAAPQGATQAGDPVATEHRARAAAIGEDVGIAIVRHADSGSGDVLVIRLDPAELGKIEVRLRMDEARQLSAEVTADQPATLDLLRRDSDNLTRALNDAGFRADDQSLRFDNRGFGQSDQQAQQGRRIASRAYLNDGDAANAQSTPTPVQVRSAGRVDLVA